MRLQNILAGSVLFFLASCIGGAVYLLVGHIVRCGPDLFLLFQGSLLVMAVIDVKKYHPFVLGGIVGFAVYAIYFAFWNFIQTPEFNYTRANAIILVIASTTGGMLAGFAYSALSKRI